MFRNPTTDLIVVLVIVLLILGPKRLPGLGKSLGLGMREFKDSISGDAKNEDEQRPEITPQATTSAGHEASSPTTERASDGSDPAAAQAPAADRSSAEVGSKRDS
jgi:sec-independent protein translocase protein TatA